MKGWRKLKEKKNIFFFKGRKLAENKFKRETYDRNNEMKDNESNEIKGCNRNRNYWQTRWSVKKIEMKKMKRRDKSRQEDIKKEK